VRIGGEFFETNVEKTFRVFVKISAYKRSDNRQAFYHSHFFNKNSIKEIVIRYSIRVCGVFAAVVYLINTGSDFGM
jgi:hypothetical protein